MRLTVDVGALRKALGGHAGGLPVIAIGPQGGKIVGYHHGDPKKPIYAGSTAAAVMAKDAKVKGGHGDFTASEMLESLAAHFGITATPAGKKDGLNAYALTGGPVALAAASKTFGVPMSGGSLVLPPAGPVPVVHGTPGAPKLLHKGKPAPHDWPAGLPGPGAQFARTTAEGHTYILTIDVSGGKPRFLVTAPGNAPIYLFASGHGGLVEGVVGGQGTPVTVAFPTASDAATAVAGPKVEGGVHTKKSINGHLWWGWAPKAKGETPAITEHTHKNAADFQLGHDEMALVLSAVSSEQALQGAYGGHAWTSAPGPAPEAQLPPAPEAQLQPTAVTLAELKAAVEAVEAPATVPESAVVTGGSASAALGFSSAWHADEHSSGWEAWKAKHPEFPAPSGSADAIEWHDALVGWLDKQPLGTVLGLGGDSPLTVAKTEAGWAEAGWAEAGWAPTHGLGDLFDADMLAHSISDEVAPQSLSALAPGLEWGDPGPNWDDALEATPGAEPGAVDPPAPPPPGLTRLDVSASAGDDDGEEAGEARKGPAEPGQVVRGHPAAVGRAAGQVGRRGRGLRQAWHEAEGRPTGAHRDLLEPQLGGRRLHGDVHERARLVGLEGSAQRRDPGERLAGPRPPRAPRCH